MAKSSRLPPASFHPSGPHHQQQRRKTLQSAKQNTPKNQAQVRTTYYNPAQPRGSSGFNKFNLPKTLSNVIQDFEMAGGTNALQKRTLGPSLSSTRGFSQQPLQGHSQQMRGQRSNQSISHHNVKSRKHETTMQLD